MLKGLHDFNWQRQVLRTLREIWQQTKQRDERKELKERSDKYSESRKKAREQANQDREKTPTKQDEETLIKKLRRQQSEIEEHKKIRQKLIEERKRTEKECDDEYRKETNRFTEMQQHLSKYHQETEKEHEEKTQRGGPSQDRDSRQQENEETLEACRIKIAKTHEQFMKEREERQELFEKLQKRKWETFRLELEKIKAKTDEEKTPTKELAKDTMIQIPKKTYKRKTTTTQPTIQEISSHMEGNTSYITELDEKTDKEIPGTRKLAYETSTLSGRETRRPKHKCHRCYLCNKSMKNANSLMIHLQSKEHKNMKRQLKEIQAQDTTTKKRKVRFK